MTDVKHYLENSIDYIENGGSYKKFFEKPFVKFGEESTGISSDDMWDMAQYVVCTYGRRVKAGYGDTKQAVREFAEQLKNVFEMNYYGSTQKVAFKEINKLLAEVTGE